MNPYETLTPHQQPKKNIIWSRVKLFFYLSLIIIFFSGCFQLNNNTEILETTTFNDLLEVSLFHGFFVYPMSRAIIVMHQWTGSTLFAIVSITIINRFVGYIFSFKATLEGEKMREIQPLINNINAKYSQKNDRLSMFAKQQEIQKLFKKYNLNPLAAFGTLIVSLPLFMGIYAAVKDNSYIKQFNLLGVNAGTVTSNSGFNMSIIFVVALLVITQYISIKMPLWLSSVRSTKPKKNAKNPTDTMALLFPVLMLFVAYSSPISILVYFTVSPIFTIIQSYILHQFLTRKTKSINKPY